MTTRQSLRARYVARAVCPDAESLRKAHGILGGNQLTSLLPEIGLLESLTELNLWKNQLTSLPLEIGQLKNSTKLNLGGNQLTLLPPEIQFKGRPVLDLDSGKITRPPPEIGQIESQSWVEVWNNPLKDAPHRVVRRGTGAILNYLKAKSKKRGQRGTLAGLVRNLFGRH